MLEIERSQLSLVIDPGSRCLEHYDTGTTTGGLFVSAIREKAKVVTGITDV